MGEIIYEKHFHKETIEEIEKDRINFVEAIGEDAEQAPSFDEMHTPPQEYSMTAEGGALVPREWCIHSGEMVHGGRRRGAPSRHAGAYSGRALRLRMDSPSIWIVYAL